MENRNWKTSKLGDLVEILSSRRVFYSDYVESGIPFYRSKEVIDFAQGNFYEPELFISKEKFEELTAKNGYPLNGDILISAVGERAGIPYVVKNLGEFYFKDGNVIWIKSSCELSNDYLSYWLKSFVGIETLNSLFIGSAQKALTIIGLKNIELQLPPFPEQKAIALALSSLDDKIDLLHQQNQTLEALAETLFRQWFIEEAKEDWEDCTIGDLAIHSKISVHPKKNPDILYYHYSIPAFDANKKPVVELGKEIQSNKYKVEENSILFSKLNPHKDKRVWLIQDNVEEHAICSTELQVVKPKDKDYLYFIYGWLTNSIYYNEIASGVGGTSGSHQRIEPKAIFTAPCVKIEKDFILQYNSHAEPLFRKQFENQQQIQTLTQLRDTLLPKLMSGEVRVKN